MELVASARLRRAQQRIEAMRPYADRMGELMAGTAKAAGAVPLPLLQRRDEIRTVAIVPITGDRGMAGAFNAQILRRAFALMRETQAEGKQVQFFSSGKKAQSTLRFRRLPLVQAWTGFSDKPAYSDAQAIAHALAEAYSSGAVDQVLVVYNAFVSPLVQRVTVQEILPVPLAALGTQRKRLPRRPIRSTSSTSPSRARSSRASCPCTWRPSSTARCSSRRRPSRARG